MTQQSALLGIFPEKTVIQKESCTTMFNTKLFLFPQNVGGNVYGAKHRLQNSRQL